MGHDVPDNQAAEMHESWLEGTRYLNMEPLAEQKKYALRRRGEAA